MDFPFLYQTFLTLIAALPLTLQLAATAIALGAVLALGLALCRISGIPPLDWFARFYIFIFRGSPLLVQIFLIYYGLGQFREVRHSMVWFILRDPYWCAVIALMLNTAAYAAEIIRGGLQSVPHGQIEAARSCGMSPFLVFRRITLPLAVRQALPAYSNEMISMVKATSLASIITIMEVTGVAAKLISETFRAIEVFVVAGFIYLAINFVLTRLVAFAEYRLSPHMRQPPAISGVAAGEIR
jgi:octopine/nopaline transport system permease protein